MLKNIIINQTENDYNIWDEYAEKYNTLSDEMERRQMDPNLLSEVINLRIEIENNNPCYPIFTQ